MTALGFIGLALTVVGLYGFLSFRVTQRRREIGIRMALGATRRATVLLVLVDTARMAAIGLGIGLALAFVAARIEKASRTEGTQQCFSESDCLIASRGVRLNS